MAIRVYRVAVVGCPRTVITNEGSFQGVGKSCLCNRFVRAEAYTEGHDSVLSKDDWTERPIYNGDHFIYWGAANKHLQDGTKVRFQVVEQTEFYELNESNRLCAHPATEDYMTRASAVRFSSCSSGKVAYRLHSEEIFARRGASTGPLRATQLFPNEDFSGKGKQGIYGYVCVFDPTLEDEQMKRQKAYVTELLHMLAKRKRKVVLACVKCDAVDDMKIRHGANLSMYALKKQLPFIEVSAREAVNVEEVFFSLIGSPKKHKLPKGAKRTSPSSWLTYRAVLDTRKHDINRARDAYRKLLQKRVTDFSVTWSEVFPALEREPEFSLVLQIAGKEGKEIVKKMFCLRLIEIKLMEASKQFGLISAKKKLDKDHSRSYQDYLSRAFKEHPDLGSESLYDYVYSPGASLAGDDTHSRLNVEGQESITEPSTPNTSSNRDTPDSANILSPISFMTDGSTLFARPRSATAAEFYHTGNKSPTGSYHSSTLPRPSSYYSHETLSIDQHSPRTKHYSFVHQSPAHSKDKPPPLPPREEGGVMGRPLSKYDPTLLSQPFLDGEAKPIGTMKREGELKRLSSSMDCLLLPEEDEGASKKNSFSRLQAEPYLQPRDVMKVLGTLPPLPPLPPLPATPRRDVQSTIFRSMRWTGTQSRPLLPQLGSSDSPTVGRSGSMKIRGHRRTKSDHLILEQSDSIPPTPPPRDKNLLPPIPPRDTNILPPIPPQDTPKHALPSRVTPPPSSASSQGLKSPIESSLDFPQAGKEGFRRVIPTNNDKSPRLSRNGEEEDGDNVSNISGPFEEISDGDKSTNELEESSEMTFKNLLERAGTPSDRSTMSSRTYKMPAMADDDDYARIEEYQQYMPMASVTVSANRRGTFPLGMQSLGANELEESGVKKFHPKVPSMIQLRDVPTKKDLPSNLSAPALAWGRLSSIWKKQQTPVDSSVHEVMENPSPPPSHASTLPSPYRKKMRSPLPDKQRPLPPSPRKSVRTSSNGLSRRVSGNDSSNIYEVIDEDLVNRVTGRKTSSTMQHSVPQWAAPADPKYLEVVQTFFNIPEIHKKWVETVNLVIPDVDPKDYPPPFYSPPSEGNEPDTTQIEGEPIEPVATKPESDIPIGLVQEHKELSPTSKPNNDQIPIHLPNSDTAPNVAMTPLQQLKHSPFPSPHVARNSPHLVMKVASRDNIIEQLNRQLRGDSDTDTDDDDDDSDDSDTDSDSDSDMDQVTDYQHRSLVHPHGSNDHTEQIEILTTDQASALTAKSSPTDLDVALSHLTTSISTDSDLVEVDSVAKSPLSSNTEDVNRYFMSSSEVTVTDYSTEMLSAVPRREKRKGELSSGPRKLSDSGISNCHSQTFEDEQNNEESEC